MLNNLSVACTTHLNEDSKNLYHSNSHLLLQTGAFLDHAPSPSHFLCLDPTRMKPLLQE